CCRRSSTPPRIGSARSHVGVSTVSGRPPRSRIVMGPPPTSTIRASSTIATLISSAASPTPRPAAIATSVAINARHHQARHRARPRPTEPLSAAEERKEDGQDDRDEDRGAQREVEAPASALDVDIAGQTSEPWHLSGELCKEEQKCSQDNHQEPEAQQDFAEV